MRVKTSGLLVALSLVASTAAFGFECANVGEAAFTDPNDTEESSNTACGDGAFAGSIGTVAVGVSAIADDNEATAVGAEAVAGYFQTIAVGSGAIANDERSIAVGANALAEFSDAVAVGTQAEAFGGASVAIGPDASADGDTSVAIGLLATTGELGDIAIGEEAIAIGGDSQAYGYSALAEGTASIAMGPGSRALNTGSVALGSGALAAQDFAVVLGAIPDPGFADTYGSVGIGTPAPESPLHIFRDDPTQAFMFLESDEFGTTQDRAMMQLNNNGGIRFEFKNPALSTAWRFQAATGGEDKFEITKVGTGEIEMALDAAGNLEIQGTLTELSDRNTKQDIVSLDGNEILQSLADVDISEWSYSDTPDSRHIGPMAQDFHAAFGLGKDAKHISARDMAGVNMAAVKALESRNQQLETQVQSLQAQLASLQEQMQLVTAVVLEQQLVVARN